MHSLSLYVRLGAEIVISIKRISSLLSISSKNYELNQTLLSLMAEIYSLFLLTATMRPLAHFLMCVNP